MEYKSKSPRSLLCPVYIFFSINLLAAIQLLHNKHLNSYLSHYTIEPAVPVNWFWLSVPLTLNILKENFTRLAKKKKKVILRGRKQCLLTILNGLFLFQTVSREHSCTCTAHFCCWCIWRQHKALIYVWQRYLVGGAKYDAQREREEAVCGIGSDFAE